MYGTGYVIEQSECRRDGKREKEIGSEQDKNQEDKEDNSRSFKRENQA